MTENIADFLTELKKRGVEIVPNEGRLRVDAPAGLLTSADRERLIARKNDILQYFRQKNDHCELVQPGDVIQWVSPVVGPAGPATVLGRSDKWLLVNKPSHEVAAPIVHESWEVRRVGHAMENKANPKGPCSTE